MLILNNGKIILNGVECDNPELLFFTLKDLSEEKYLEFDFNKGEKLSA